MYGFMTAGADRYGRDSPESVEVCAGSSLSTGAVLPYQVFVDQILDSEGKFVRESRAG